MSNFLKIFTMLFKYRFKRDKSENKSKSMWIIYGIIALSYLFLAGLIVFVVIQYATIFNEMGMTNELITMLLLVGCVATLILGLISMLSYLYFSKDTEFFMTLPVKPSTIFMAKFMMIYINELLISSLILIPCLITIGVVLQMSAVYYFTMLFVLLLLPAIPLLLASILAIPLMYLVSFFKNKGALSSIVVIILFGAIFGIYYFVVAKFSSSSEHTVPPEQQIEGMRKAFMGMSNIFYPLYAIAKFSTLTPVFGLNIPISMLLNAFIFLLTVVLLVVIAIIISNAVYRRGAATQLEGGKTKIRANMAFTASSATKALVKKEWRELIRTTAYSLQCLSGTVLCPILTIFLSFTISNVTSGELAEAQINMINNMIWFVALGMIVMMGIGTNVGASTSITREGSMFYYCKILPVDYRTQIKAKATLYFIISYVTIFISLIILSIINFNLLNLILGLGFLGIYNYGFVNFALYFDLTKPKLNWVTPNEAVKNSRNSTIPMLINMGISVILIIIPIFVTMIIPLVWLSTLIAWLVLYSVAITGAVIFHVLLNKNVDKLYERIIV